MCTYLKLKIMSKAGKISSLLSSTNTTMFATVFTLGFVSLLLEAVNGFTVGVPPLRTVCITMTPQHHKYPPQRSDAPFTVTVDKNEVTGGSDVNVRLTSTDPDTKFIGFYVQARDINDGAIGTFTPNDLTKVHSCGGVRANAAHHASGEVKKDNVTISWRAPKKYQGEVAFTATLVRDFVTYWVFVMSDPVSITQTVNEQQNQIIPPTRTNVNNNNRNSIINPSSNPITNFFQSITSRFGSGLQELTMNKVGNRDRNNNGSLISNNNVIRNNNENDNRSPSENKACVLTLFKLKLFCLSFQG